MSTLATRDRVDRAGLVDGVLRDVAPTLGAAPLSQKSRDAFDNATTAVRDIVGTQDQLDRDLDELTSKRDLMPRAGADRLRREAEQEAHSRSQEAGGRWDRAVKELRESLLDDALPRYPKEREALARQELALVIGEAQGGGATNRALNLVRSGSREAIAVLLRDSFGRSLLESRGVSGRDLNEFLTSARTIASGDATERGETERERAAGAALAKLGTLGAARGAAGVVRIR